MNIRPVVFAASIAFCGVSWSDALVSIEVEKRVPREADDSQSISISGLVQAATTLSYSGGSGTAYADLSAGILRGSAVAPPIVNPIYEDRYGLYSTKTKSQISDTVTFSADASGLAYLQWRVDGTVTAYHDGDSAGGSLELVIFGPRVEHRNWSVVENHSWGNYSCDLITFLTTCMAGTIFDQSGTIAIPIVSGQFTIHAALKVVAADNAVANFSNTGRLYLELPIGVTVSSGTGVFLSTATPITSVPEPGTGLLMLAGFGLFWLRRSRQR